LKKFSDFAKNEEVMIGNKIKIDNILGREIQVLGYKINKSKYKTDSKLLTLQIILNKEERVVFTGSNVLIEQCEKYKNEMPFLAKIEKIDKFYTFT